MPAKIIDGTVIGEKIRHEIARDIEALKARGVTPGLAVVLVGEHPASQSYVRSKNKAAHEIGMHSEQHDLAATTTQTDLVALIERLNRDPKIHGILVQLPLPDAIDERAVITAISPEKDVDGFHPVSLGRIMTGEPGFRPCTPFGIQKLLEYSGTKVEGSHVVVVGRSNIVGKPVAQLLLAAHATVTIAHSRTRDLAGVCREADVLVVAVGKAEMVRGDWIKPGAVVIDVGTNRVPAPEKGEGQTKLVGDVCFTEAKEVASAITPVPGGVGPMTIACLLENTLIAASRRAH